MLKPTLRKNDRLANMLIITFSVVVFAIVSALGKTAKLDVELPFDPHIFGAANAIINSIVAVLLVIALVLVRKRAWTAHRNVMLVAMVLSILFLVSYITHKLFSGESLYGDANHDDVLSAAELAAVSGTRLLYRIILATHIVLAGVILPFILYTAYRGLNGDYARHKKLARWTWPLWLYVSITGPIVYLFIAPYYH